MITGDTVLESGGRCFGVAGGTEVVVDGGRLFSRSRSLVAAVVRKRVALCSRLLSCLFCGQRDFLEPIRPA